MISGIEQIYSEKGDTWPKILKYNYEKYGDKRKAMRHNHYGIWKPYTWKDYYLSVKYFALGLLSLGFEPGDKALIIGDNAPQWYHAELAAQSNHGASVGLFSDLTPREIEQIAENSEARFAVVEDQEQVDKFLQIKDKLPLLKKVIHWKYKGLAHYGEPILTGYRQLLILGERYEKEHPGIFERNVETGKSDDICALVYTSGTTGTAPKGAVHTYGTMIHGAYHYLSLDPWHEDDNVVPYLPPVSMMEQWFGIGCHLLSASILNFAEAPETHQRDTRQTGPSIVCYGARLWESQASMVHARIIGADAIKRFVFRLLMPVGYKMADLRFKKQKPSLLLKILNALSNIALFNSIKRSLGLLNARICYTTGAMLSPDAFRFYHALNIPLKNLYWTTEGGSLTGAKNDDILLETVGPPHDGTEVKTNDDGELVYRQPGVFMGYHKNPDKTAEVLKDGWFYSGDCASLREDGHIVFVDRVKDLIELEKGDKLAPQLIESRLRFSPHIMDAWVLGSQNKDYVSAIIIISYDNVGRWAGQMRVAYKTFAELSQKPEVYGLVKRDIARINRDLPRGARVKKFVNLHREFNPDEGELTRTRNLRRIFLEERYRDIIDAIYVDRTEVSLESQMTLSIHSVEGAA